MMETSDKSCMEGICQSYKADYDKEISVSAGIERDIHINLDEKESKPVIAEVKAADRRKNLNFYQVSQRKVVYVTGIPTVLADEEKLRQNEYFGQYGKVSKISVLKNGSHTSQDLSAEPSFNVYVTFLKAEDAMQCIQSLNGHILNGKRLKATFGEKNYFNACLDQMPCHDSDCFCPPKEGTWEGSFVADQLYTQSGRKRVLKADSENERVDDCESDGDNFSCTKNESKQGCSGFHVVRSPWDRCKRQKFVAGKVKDKVSVFQETETSSVESISALTVGTGAKFYVTSSADHIAHEFASLGDKIIKLDGNNHDFKMVQSKFYMGLGSLASFVTIKCIYKHCHRSTSAQARLQAFKRQEDITRISRGGSNVRFAWHGTSKAGISIITLHGFGQPAIPKDDAMYGIGVYLAPEDYSHVSAVDSDVDENGEQHMVLCRVIMGNMEQVEQGSEQFHPASEDYDTGVDDLCNPRRYIVWSTHMNTHILPEYIISFKLSPPWNDIISTLRKRHANTKPTFTGKGIDYGGQVSKCRTCSKTSCTTCIPVKQHDLGPSKAPRSPWMSFPMLFLVMKEKLTKAQLSELQRHYLHFKVGKMPRDELIKVVRSIAGDRLLSDSIRNMQAQHASLLGRRAEDRGYQPLGNRDC